MVEKCWRSSFVEIRGQCRQTYSQLAVGVVASNETGFGIFARLFARYIPGYMHGIVVVLDSISMVVTIIFCCWKQRTTLAVRVALIEGGVSSTSFSGEKAYNKMPVLQSTMLEAYCYVS